jgi:hypothetical protein
MTMIGEALTISGIIFMGTSLANMERLHIYLYPLLFVAPSYHQWALEFATARVMGRALKASSFHDVHIVIDP